MSVKDDVKKIVSNVNLVASDTEVAVTKALGGVKNKVESASSKIAELKHEAVASYQKKLAKAKINSIKAKDQVTEYTKENPLKAIGIAVVAGAVLTKLLGLRKKK